MKKKIISMSAVGLVLAACGGGGSSGDAPTSVAASIFSEPQDLQCELVLGEKICNAPTSSRGSKEQIKAALNDPLAGAMRFSQFGFTINSDNLLSSDGSQLVAVSGQASYGGSEEALVIGQNALQFKGKSYRYDKTFPNSEIRGYCATKTDCIYIDPNVPWDQGESLVQFNATDTTGSSATSQVIEGHGKYWEGYFGLLSDRNDVSVPADETIKYQGVVIFQGGDGTPLGASQFNGGSVACSIEFALNTRNGQVSTSGATCTDNQNSQLQFSLANLQVEKSRIRSGVAGDAASASAPRLLSLGKEQLFARVDSFKSTQVAGGIYGKNAAVLTVLGSGTQGAFFVIANRL
jgi:hypothetical protein